MLLIDVGTVPSSTAIERLFVAMEADSNCGGACGEISVRNMRPWVWLDAAQVSSYLILCFNTLRLHELNLALTYDAGI